MGSEPAYTQDMNAETHPAGTVLVSLNRGEIRARCTIVKWTPSGKARLSTGDLATVRGWGDTQYLSVSNGASRFATDWQPLTPEIQAYHDAQVEKHRVCGMARTLAEGLRMAAGHEPSKVVAAKAQIEALAAALGIDLASR